ncbi:MAG: hypothetical protein AAF409_21200 [Pseudomonadota bacterium]
MRIALALISLGLVFGTPASAEPATRAWEDARRAVAELRSASFLPTGCERAFAAFWRTYVAEGDRGFIRWPDGSRPDPIFGFGNVEAAGLLGPAIRICEKETQSPGDMVIRVLEERASAKRDRRRDIERSARSVMGY